MLNHKFIKELNPEEDDICGAPDLKMNIFYRGLIPVALLRGKGRTEINCISRRDCFPIIKGPYKSLAVKSCTQHLPFNHGIPYVPTIMIGFRNVSRAALLLSPIIYMCYLNPKGSTGKL